MIMLLSVMTISEPIPRVDLVLFDICSYKE